jgi:hypothetical protein
MEQGRFPRLARTRPEDGLKKSYSRLATVDFLHKLIEEMPAASDQEHLPTVVWNVPQIPDRQEALAGTGTSSLPAMCAGIDRLVAAGATRIASRHLAISIDTNRAMARACVASWQQARR